LLTIVNDILHLEHHDADVSKPKNINSRMCVCLTVMQLLMHETMPPSTATENWNATTKYRGRKSENVKCHLK